MLFLFHPFKESPDDVTLSSSAALHPGVRGHHRSPPDLGRAPLHKGQQQRQEPAHLHHILCVGTKYTAADIHRYKVTNPSLTVPVNHDIALKKVHTSATGVDLRCLRCVLFR